MKFKVVIHNESFAEIQDFLEKSYVVITNSAWSFVIYLEMENCKTAHRLDEKFLFLSALCNGKIHDVFAFC